MPRSSVYVRLQWPAGEGGEEVQETSPELEDSTQLSSLSTHKTQQPLSSIPDSQQPKEEKDGCAEDNKQRNIQPPERQEQDVHKCSVCPDRSQALLHSCAQAKSLPVTPHPASSVSTHASTALVVTSLASVSGTSTTITITTTSISNTTTTITTSASAGKHNQHLESASGMHAKAKVKVKDTPREKLRRNLTEKSHRTHQVKERMPGAHQLQRGPPLDTSYSLDSPLWHSREQRPADGESEPQEGDDNKPEGVRTYYKSKARLRPRNPNAKGRRITRSLSASCVSVSTNTDPKDFLELAKITGTVPSKKKEKEPLASKVNITPSDCDQRMVTSRTEKGDGGNIEPIDSTGFPETKLNQNAIHKQEKEKEGKAFQQKETTVGNEDMAEVVLEDDIIEKLSDTRCAGDGCDDAEKGYIELPTYIPSQPHLDTQGKRHDTLPPHAMAPTVSSLPMTPCGPPYPSFHAHTGPLPLSPPYCTVAPMENSTEDNKFIVITPHLSHPPPSDLKVETVLPIISHSPSSLHLKLSPISHGYENNQAFSTFRPPTTRTFHIATQENTGLTISPHCTNPSSSQSFTVGELVTPEAGPQEAFLSKPLTSPSTEAPVSDKHCGKGDKSPLVYPANRPPTPAVPRRHLERDMSLDSCPDVVLQTLEGEGASCQSKTLKKTVTFLLPPDHWDSLISLRESCSMLACGWSVCPLWVHVGPGIRYVVTVSFCPSLA